MWASKNGNTADGMVCATLLDALDTGVMVLRPAGCELLFINAAARGHYPQYNEESSRCPLQARSETAPLCEACRAAKAGADGLTLPLEFSLGSGQAARCYTASLKPVRWVDQKPAHLLQLQDITRQKELEARLHAEAYTDTLTGLPNRRRLKEDLATWAAGDECLGVVALFDLDNFKQVNDAYGHNTGDVLLCRLAAHLRQNPDWGGQFYRIGGDEFVFCCTRPRNGAKEDAFCQEMGERLQQLLHAYTIPVVDLSCTLSIGLSFFPAHGTTPGELLRKADIALYRAKQAGGNQMAVFEDWFDSARKFNDFYISLRPVLNAAGSTCGYELTDSALADDDENRVALNQQEYNRAIDLLCPADLDSDITYFIHYTNQLGHAAVQSNLPKERFVIEVPASAGKREWKAYKALKENGYRLAVRNLGRDHASYSLLKLADYVSFSPALSAGTRKKLIDAHPGTQFIATDIDTLPDFEAAQKQGYKLFQGRFFQQPVKMQKTKEVDPLQANYCRLLALTAAEYVDFGQIADIVSSDVSLSYRLLRLLNSASLGLRNRITSVEMAIPYLGEENLKRWIALVALRGLAGDKPLELVRMSLVRARFGELLSGKITLPGTPKQVFFCGMLSLLHAALDMPQEELFSELVVVDDDIKRSLLSSDGIYSELMAFFGHYEYSDWDDVAAFAQKHQLQCEDIYQAHMDAVQWYNQLVAV